LKETQLPTFVTFNVGGATFRTSIENLTKIPNTYFSALFSSRWDLDTQTDIFIGRSPIMFGQALDYLRGDHMVTEDLSVPEFFGSTPEDFKQLATTSIVLVSTILKLSPELRVHSS